MKLQMKISVVTAVYNRKDTIEDALLSVQSQDYENVEHVIQDGCSKDGTLEVVNKFLTPTTNLVSEPDSGIYDAINKGIERSSGDVIGLMHSDDFFARPNILSKVARVFENSEIDGVYGDLEYVAYNDPSRVIRRWRSGEYSHNLLLNGWMPPHPTLYLRREVFDKWGLYDTSFQIAADYDAMLRYLWTGNISLAYIPEVFVKMRVGGESNRSIGRILRKSREDYQALKNNGVGGAATLLGKNVRKVRQFIIKESQLNE